MLVDYLLTFSDKQALATGNSTTTLDTKAKSTGDAGVPIILFGHNLAPSNLTVAVKLQHSDDNSAFTDAAASKTFSVAELANGRAFYAPVSLKRYIRLAYTVTGTVTTGAITAFMGNAQDIPANYAAAYGGSSQPT